MANGIRTVELCRFNKGRSSKFDVGSWVWQIPEEDRRTYRPKRYRNNNKDEDNSPKTLNDKNHHASSQKFWQQTSLSRIWTQPTDSISYNHYDTHTSMNYFICTSNNYDSTSIIMNISIIISIPCVFFSVNWWFFNGVWARASLLKSPGLFSVFWPISIMLWFGWSPLVLLFPSPPVPVLIVW